MKSFSKVGDRITHHLYGDGSIVAINVRDFSHSSGAIVIYFDNAFAKGHTCENRVPDKHGRYFNIGKNCSIYSCENINCLKPIQDKYYKLLHLLTN